MSESNPNIDNEVVIRIYPSTVTDKTELTATFPIDIDEDNLRPHEEAGRMILQWIVSHSEEFERIKDH